MVAKDFQGIPVSYDPTQTWFLAPTYVLKNSQHTTIPCPLKVLSITPEPSIEARGLDGMDLVKLARDRKHEFWDPKWWRV